MALTATTVLLVAFAAFRNTLAAPLVTDNITPAESSTASASPVASSALSTLSPTSLNGIIASETTSMAPMPSGSTILTSTQTSLSSANSPSSVGFSSPDVSTSTTTLEPSSSSSLQLAMTTLSPATSTVEFTTTVVSTIYQSASLVTVTAPPQTVTDTITIVPPPTPPPTVRKTSWSAPPQMTDLSAFNVKNFAYGQKNMRIIVSDPTTDERSDSDSSSRSSSSSSSSHSLLGSLTGALGALLHAVAEGIIPPPPKKASSSFIELFYPAHSINPGQKPQGGADFYAVPLDLRGARNVSLEYSVFFPSNFDWVQGGKMPGIYGGHDGCSGGDEALDCFSTRLMWRKGGAGELYLYAPKVKQTAALCKTPPQTVCESDYGLSVARGSFKFAAGNWTHVRQTVALNTPGKQDGGFTLDVNGKRVIDLHDVFYRDTPSAGAHKPGLLAAADDAQGEQVLYDEDAPQVKMDLTNVSDEAGGLQDSIAWFTPPVSYIPSLDYTPMFDPSGVFMPAPAMDMQDLAPQDWNETGIATVTVTHTTAVMRTTVVPLPPQTTTVNPNPTKTAYVVDMETGLPLPGAAIAYAAPQAVGFVGLFFSTFFGGHESRFATPKDQFSWFKDFAMTINA
ncbi:hypothetical protein C8Q80DRAFT_289331 [Daedaleopsis nitida]|nr:hypothetical protein C8Q80DRAFT_289331 [Daedaleopsis nitida]